MFMVGGLRDYVLINGTCDIETVIGAQTSGFIVSGREGHPVADVSVVCKRSHKLTRHRNRMVVGGKPYS